MLLPSVTFITVAFSQLNVRMLKRSANCWGCSRKKRIKRNRASHKGLGEYIKILVADDAGQFHHQTQHRGLCWIHEARHYEKRAPSDSDSSAMAG